MKKLMCTLLVAMLTMVSMTTMAFPPISKLRPYFKITNLTTRAQPTIVYTEDFPSDGKLTVDLEGGLHDGDVLQFDYNPIVVLASHRVQWTYGWENTVGGTVKTGFTVDVSVGYPHPFQNTFVVDCDFYEDEQSSTFKRYTMNFEKASKRSQITVKSSNASEVQVSYENYGEVLSAGQRASVALYDIYGNKVSGGYLDALGMGTLSTKGKPGYYIVKVTMNNQVIFTETIHVK